MFNKLFLTFVACATIVATALLFFENNKGLLPSTQSPWTALSFKEPANAQNLDFFIQNNSPESREFTYRILTEDGTVLDTTTLTLSGGEKKLVTPAYQETTEDTRITIEVQDDLTTQKIYR